MIAEARLKCSSAQSSDTFQCELKVSSCVLLHVYINALFFWRSVWSPTVFWRLRLVSMATRTFFRTASRAVSAGEKMLVTLRQLFVAQCATSET